MTTPPLLQHDPARLAHLADGLRIARSRALRGPNLWYLAPALQAELRLGDLASLTGDDLPGLLANLSAALPALDLGGLDEARRDPARTHADSAWWGTLLVRVALELERRAGTTTSEGRVVLSDPAGDHCTVAIRYDEEGVTDDSVREAARVLRDALRGDDPEIDDTVRALRERYARERPDPSTRALMDAARRRGIAVRRTIDTDVVQLGLGITQRRVLGGATERTSAFAADVVADSRRLRRILSGVGLPVGESQPDSRGYGVLVVDGAVVGVRELGPDGAILSPDALHPQLAASCGVAVGAVGLDVGAVDLFTPNLAAPLREGHGVVNTVHASPDLTAYTAPGDHAAAEAVLAMLYPAGAPTTIPVVTVTGTNGKTTTTRLIAHLFRQTGRTVGFTTTDGVYLQEEQLLHGDLTGPFAANIILTHRATEVAVLETARGGILKSGLGFDESDVAVVMNVTADHLGLRGIETVEQLADVKAVLPAVVKPAGCAVLNADDPLVLAMRARTRGRIALFTTEAGAVPPAIAEQLAAGGIVARVEREDDGEHLVIREGARRVDLGAAAGIPLTFGGLARFQLQNVLAACTAAYVQGVSDDELRRGLATFIPSLAATPGRLNLIETPRGRVLLDYAHNVAAIAGLFDFVRAMPARRRMALLSAPGDRRDEDLRAIGRLATGLDLVIMKEHEVYRRGREPGEIATIMAEGLRETGVPEERLLTFVEERDAVLHVLSVMEPGDVVIIIADDTLGVTRLIEEADQESGIRTSTGDASS